MNKKGSAPSSEPGTAPPSAAAKRTLTPFSLQSRIHLRHLILARLRIRLKETVVCPQLFAGNIKVENKGTLHLYGMCTGNIEILPGGTVQLDGMCTGNVLNSGGKLILTGTVNGNVVTTLGETTIDKKAVISSGK